jgi:3-dehydroquinate dehydratase/shikimate dehydrogenase
MLFVSIPHPSMMQQIQNELISCELRLDLFPEIEIESIRTFLQNSTAPVMLTLRKASQGGKFQGSESEREALIVQLLSLNPPFFDLEYDMDPTFLRGITKRHPKTKFVLSYHNFERTPEDLEGLYSSMQKIPTFTYKIAALALSTNDALKMLLFAQKHPKVSVICMGEKGEFARVLAPIVGGRVNYACLNEETKTGPGQLSFRELVDIYNYPTFNENTEIYGLIGDSVGKSPGHRHHNAVFRKLDRNAVYVKMEVKPEELAEFIPLATALGIRGLSVTIPLKEKIVPFIDEIGPAVRNIGAINTLQWKNGRILGTNTDGHGALDAIEKKTLVRGKKIVLLGAGGAARAIAFEAIARGASLLILNRTVQRAQVLALELGCEAGGLDASVRDYDILINCSPDSMPIDEKNIRSGTIAMDVVYAPRETLFLKEASLKGCQIVYGEEMYLNQAARQTAFWMGP